MNPTKRFSDRVENYIKYRPSYPKKIIHLLEENCGFNKDKVVADIGAGTGILTKLFLDNDNQVFGVEPNKEMREAAERLLQEYTNFTSIDASAENTELKPNLMDFVVAGQSFHWFEIEKVKEEFKRILNPEGWIVLIWNVRKTNQSGFMKAYENLLLNHALEYQTVSHKNISIDIIGNFFKPGSFKLETYVNDGIFNFEGLKGRLLSSSFAPKENESGYKLECRGFDFRVKLQTFPALSGLHLLKKSGAKNQT